MRMSTEEYLEELGSILYTKILELDKYGDLEVTEEDCINYIKEEVIKRAFDGYMTEIQTCINYIEEKEEDIRRTFDRRVIEIQTIYGQLQNILGVPVKPAPDEWDRFYNVDFFIEVGDKYIGLQIKPTTFENAPEDYKWKEVQETSHRKFQERFGGKVFIVFSVKEGQKKVIKNIEVIDEIRKEIERLKKE